MNVVHDPFGYVPKFANAQMLREYVHIILLFTISNPNAFIVLSSACIRVPPLAQSRGLGEQ